jgi:hypothetical protein
MRKCTAQLKSAAPKLMSRVSTCLWIGIGITAAYAIGWSGGASYGLETAPPKLIDWTGTEVTNACAHHGLLAAGLHGVPAGVLMAVMKHESNLNPTIMNVEGATVRSVDKREAIARARGYTKAGRSYDIGCGQINHRWHHERVTKLYGEAMGTDDAIALLFRPAINTDYAARYLKELHQQAGSWDGAIGLYHSKDGARQISYLSMIKRQAARLHDQGVAALAK